MTNYILEALFAIVIIGIADWQAHYFAENKAISHWKYGLVFIGVITLLWFLGSQSILFGAALVLQHFVFFSSSLNLIRGKDVFYIHSGDNGSWWDRQFLKIQKAYPFLWGMALGAFITLQWFI